MSEATDWIERLLLEDTASALQELRSQGRFTADAAHTIAEAGLIAAEANLSRARGLLAVADALSAGLTRPADVEAHLAYAQARLSVHRGDLIAAEEHLRRARSLWQAAGDPSGVMRTWLGLTQTLAMQGRFDEAEATAQGAISALVEQERSLENQRRLANAYHNLATLYLVQDRHEPALAEYARAGRVLESLRSAAATEEEAQSLRVEQAHNALNRATALTFLDRPEEAEAALAQAIAEFTALGDVVNRGRARVNLGRLFLRTGRYADALALFDNAAEDIVGRSVAEVVDPEQLRMADELLLERATAQLALNLLPEAAQALAICESLFRSAGQQVELAQALYLRGLVELRGEAPSNATQPLTEARALFDALGNRFWRNRSSVALAMVAVEEERLDDARASLEDLLASATAASVDALSWDLPALIEARLLRAQVAQQLGDEGRAAQEIAACAAQLGLTSASPEQATLYSHHAVRVFHARGRLARSQGRYAEATGDLRVAVELLERQRIELPLEEIRSAFLDDKSAVYADLLLAVLDAPDADEGALTQAFDILERARSRTLLERMATNLETQLVEADAAVPSQLQRLEEARRRLHWLYNRLLGEDGERHVDGAVSQAIQAEEAVLHDRLMRTSPRLVSAQAAGLTEFQSTLNANVQAIVYAAAGDELLAFVIDRANVRVTRQVCSLRAVATAQADLRYQMGRAGLGGDYVARHQRRLLHGVQSALKKLYELVLVPLLPSLQAEELLISPTGSLHLLPFHALWDGESYLLERFVIRLTPSASMAVRCARRKSRPLQSARWAGVALSDKNIPAARQEVELAAQRFTRARLFLEEEATLAGLRAAAQEDILHIAAHGLYRSDNPFFSMLKLADGWVDVRTLYRLPLAAQLVVLSACESGVGKVRGGDEVIGLVRGFLGAGASTVVASLWNVHDASAASLMADFYLALTAREDATPAQALRSAQRNALANGAHPYFWAPFFVTGR